MLVKDINFTTALPDLENRLNLLIANCKDKEIKQSLSKAKRELIKAIDICFEE